MRVLWFTNSPSLAKEKLNQVSYGGGWMESLQEKLQGHPEVELALSFYSNNQKEPFIYNNCQYFPIPFDEVKGRVNKIIHRITHKIEDEENETKKILSVIEQFNPDIIHIFGTEKTFGLIANKSKVPVLIWLQGIITVYNTKWHSGVTDGEIKKYITFRNRFLGFGVYHAYPKMLKVAKREQKIFDRCKYFLGRTDWDRRITKILAPEAEYFHCEEMLRPPFYNSQFKAKKEDEFNIISVLNPDIYKGFETAFQTMALLRMRYPHYNIKWRIVGVNGSEEIIRIIEKKVGCDPKKLNIEYAGKLKSDALIPLLLNSDLFIHPSHIENSPNSICEAMILGMPIICTCAGGVSSLLENNKEGIIIQDGDQFSLAGAIVETIENYDRALVFGQEARKRALIRHNPENIINTLLNIYKKVKK